MSETQAEAITQETFTETPYNDAAWEIVGEPPSEGEFAPLEIEIVKADQVLVDQMFANYGGQTEVKAEKRWHLPEELAVKQANKEAGAEEVDEEPVGITLQEEELANMKAEAEKAGRTKAVAEAKVAEEALKKSLGTRLDTLLTDMKKQMEENVAVVERYAVQLALEISNKLVSHAVEINPEYITSIVQEAVGSVGGATINRVRVSPEDLEFIKVVGLPEKLSDPERGWSFEADPAIKAGCVVDSSAGEADFQLDKAWDRIRRNVLKSLA